ncbi:hypothetical protein TNCV_4807481 [Trichonephila clavipes]|nr:hypothetical protein TNCV_4807481 [Trichonephila clavipes]
MGSRTRGRPPTRWIDDVENDLKTLNILKTGRELLRIVGIGGSELWRQPRPVTAASSLVRLVAEGEGWEALALPQGVLPQKWGRTKLNRTVTCLGIKATVNDSVHLASCHDEFRGLRSDYVGQDPLIESIDQKGEPGVETASLEESQDAGKIMPSVIELSLYILEISYTRNFY